MSSACVYGDGAMKLSRGMRPDHGMTLPEVMIASSVLLVCLTALATLLGGAISSSETARMRDEAANLANERIEAARSLTYDNVGVHYASGVSGDPAGDILTPETVGDFVVNTECTWVRTTTGRAAYKKLVVRVSWEKPTYGQIEVTTMITGKSDIVTSGDLEVRLRYREDASPVENATVAIRDTNNSARSVTSDASGTAFFGQVAIGAVTMAVTPPAGYVVDTSTISSATVAADAVSTIIVYVQKPAQSTIHVAGTNGAAISGASVTLRRADGTVSSALVTDANGDVTFTQLLYADYTATVTKTGYASASSPFTLSVGNASPTVDFSMSALVGAGIHVRVFDTNGTQVPAATVAVYASGSSTAVQQGAGGTNGEISFTGLTAGAYTITVAKSSYTSQTGSTTLVDGSVSTVDFQLVAASSNGNMYITTRNASGTATSLRVIVSGSGYYRNDLYTSSSGTLTLTNLVPGSYSVQCYTKAASVATVIVAAGQTANVSISQKR
jgi:prepilin-type N-terminal cleavage/methylation domain-containing protein